MTQEDQKRSEEQEPGFCWAVVFSNYEPAEVDNLFATRALAKARAELLGDAWCIERWAIRGWRDDYLSPDAMRWTPQPVPEPALSMSWLDETHLWTEREYREYRLWAHWYTRQQAAARVASPRMLRYFTADEIREEET